MIAETGYTIKDGLCHVRMPLRSLEDRSITNDNHNQQT